MKDVEMAEEFDFAGGDFSDILQNGLPDNIDEDFFDPTLIEMMRDQMGIVDGDEFSDDDGDEYDWYDGETDSESDS